MGTYLRPASLDEALAALETGRRTVLAGATDILPAWVGRPVDDDIVDISGLPGLREIVIEDGRVRIPAGATWTDLLRADLPPAFEGIRAAARAIGGVQIQNRATVCGNVCNASPAADGTPNLMALDAMVELASTTGRRVVPVESFVTGNRRTVRRDDELVTALLVRLPEPGTRASFRKLGARAYLVISIASVAALAQIGSDGRIAVARIAVGACSEVPRRLPRAEARLVGARASAVLADRIVAADLADLTPIDDVRASAEYRRDAALALVRRTVADVLA